jgi:hypothetical protein
VLAVVCVAGTLLFLANVYPYHIDDAWITYRYARNLAEGNGFVYNLGERVQGTSTPLYTCLLAGLHALGLPLPETSHALGLLGMYATLLGLYFLVRQLHSAQAGLLAAAFVVIMPPFHEVMVSGMETPLYTSLVVFAFHALTSGKTTRAAVLAALCLLTRLDGLAVGAAIFFSLLVCRRTVPWRALAIYLLVAAPWYVFAQLYFGSPVPHSFVAKSQHAGPRFRTWMPLWLVKEPVAYVGALGTWIGLAAPRSRECTLALAVWCCGYATAFTFPRLWKYDWYLTPMAVILTALAAIAVAHLAQELRRAGRFELSWKPVVGIALGVLLVAHPVRRIFLGLEAESYGFNKVEHTRREAALWMKQNIPDDAVVATAGIGVIGYETRNYILDTVGLVSPQVVERGGESAESFATNAIVRFRPQYLFLSSWHRVPTAVAGEYDVVKVWMTGAKRVTSFTLYGRKTNESPQ